MELADIQYRARAQREFTVACDHATFTLRRPYPFDVALCEGRARQAGAGTAAMVMLERELLRLAVVGWQTVRVADVIEMAPDAAAEDMPFDSAAVELVLNARPEWAASLSTELFQRMAQANARREAAEKN